jgi:hypothetical protein
LPRLAAPTASIRTAAKQTASSAINPSNIYQLVMVRRVCGGSAIGNRCHTVPIDRNGFEKRRTNTNYVKPCTGKHCSRRRSTERTVEGCGHYATRTLCRSTKKTAANRDLLGRGGRTTASSLGASCRRCNAPIALTPQRSPTHRSEIACHQGFRPSTVQVGAKPRQLKTHRRQPEVRFLSNTSMPSSPACLSTRERQVVGCGACK